MGNWAELQQDLLILVAKRIDSLEDFVSFGGVCTKWRSVAVKENFNTSSPQLPWLMLAEKEEEEDDENNNMRQFFSLSKGGMIRKVPLPEARGKRCMESLGWFVTAAEDGEMELLHPFSRVQIALPQQTTFKYYQEYWMESTDFIHKAVLSASPSQTPNYVLMVIHGGCNHLGYWRPGDESWTVIETHNAAYDDITYFKGHFYAVDTLGAVMICDVVGPNPTTVAQVRVVGGIPTQLIATKQTYLVESAGALLIVARDVELDGPDIDKAYEDITEYVGTTYETTNFQVFVLDLSNQRWQEIKDLGGRALFLGQSASVSVDASRFPTIKPNCIYYTDDCLESYAAFSPQGGGKDMGVFNLEDGSREPHYKGESLSFTCPPVWVTPSF